jgi:hypothetical protein
VRDGPSLAAGLPAGAAASLKAASLGRLGFTVF